MPPKKRIHTIPFESIVVDVDFNCRKEYTEIDELKNSILEDGLLQPMGVAIRPDPDNPEETQHFLVYGFRRYYAISKIRDDDPDAYASVDVVINEGNFEDLRVRNLKENIERKSLSTYEIAQQVKRLVLAGIEQRDIAARLGRNQSWVSYHYKVSTNLSHQAQMALKEGDLTLEQALHIADVPEEKQNDLVNSVRNADTRADAKKILKEATSESGRRRKYANKGRPTAKNLNQWVSDVSYEAESSVNSDEEHLFFNGVAAGIRIALGDLEVEGLSFEEKYGDVNFHTRNNKTEESTEEASNTAEASDGEEQPPRRKRGRPRKNQVVSETA